MESITWIVLSYSTLEQQDKFQNYIFNKTGQILNLGPIDYGGKGTILFMKDDLSRIHHSNITCALRAGKYHFKDVDKFIEWYDKYCLNLDHK